MWWILISPPLKHVTKFVHTDPEALTWDPLDGELSQKLDKRAYVSLSRDRSAFPDSSRPTLEPDVDEEALSLFEINMPGVLSLGQVKALDLDHWLLLVQGTFVEMSVSHARVPLPLYDAGLFSALTSCRILLAGKICQWISLSLSKGSLLNWPQC